MSLACYLHVPFCAKICTYCDFYRLVHDEESERRYADAIVTEITLRSQQWQAQAALETHRSGISGRPLLHTIYFGGGTPSVLSPETWERIVTALRDNFEFEPDLEFTSEANPESSTPEKLSCLRALGVNRISFGAQSFAAANLSRLGRLHSAQQVGVAVAAARDAGFDNISIDLMYGLPDETDATYRSDLEAAVALKPQHVSFYSLMLEGAVPLRYQVQRREVTLPDDDVIAERYLHAIAFFAAAGLEHYEISNFAQPGRRCRHNLAYWEASDYLAFGPAAVGTIGDRRYKNDPDIFRYVQALAQKRLPPADVEEITPGKRLIETIMLSLRTHRGLDHRSLAARFDYDILTARADLLAALQQDGDAVLDGDFLRLTPRGLFRSDLIMSLLLPDTV